MRSFSALDITTAAELAAVLEAAVNGGQLDHDAVTRIATTAECLAVAFPHYHWPEDSDGRPVFSCRFCSKPLLVKRDHANLTVGHDFACPVPSLERLEEEVRIRAEYPFDSEGR